MRLLAFGMMAFALLVFPAHARAVSVQEIIDAAKCAQTELLDGASVNDEADNMTQLYRGSFANDAVKVCIVRKDQSGRFIVSAVDYVDNPQMPIMVRYFSGSATMYVGELAKPKNYNNPNAKPAAACNRAPVGVNCEANPRAGSPFTLYAGYTYRSEPPKYRIVFTPEKAVGPYREFAKVAPGSRPRVATEKGAIQLKGYSDPEHSSLTFSSLEQDTRNLIAYAQQVPGNTPIEYQIDAMIEGKAVAVGRAVKSDTGALLLLFNAMEKMAQRIAIGAR